MRAPATMVKLESFALGLLGAALGLSAGLWVRAGEAPDASMPASESPDLEPVLAELRAIRELLAAPPLESPRGTAEDRAWTEPPISAPAPDSGELVAAMRSLEATILGTRGMGDPLGSPTDDGPTSLRGEEARPIDIEEVRLARASIEAANGVRVDPALFGLSPAQVYARLGTPTAIGNSPGRVRWIYDDPGYPLDLVVTFFDGYVAWVHLAGE